ncbi:MAG: flagellar hook protein FlgE [Candidatus Tectimicrobiota bacterium]
MSINSALYTGVSGLNAYSNAISLIGNNIANVNTTGFKASRGNFSDILSASSGTGGTLQIGRGVLVNSVAPVFTQGAFQATSLPGDLAVDGDGFFIVKDPQTNALLYTRTGNFSLDKEGKLATPQGLVLQGFDVDNGGNALPLVEDVNISGQSFPPKLSSAATVQVNLSSDATVSLDSNTGLVTPFDPASPNDSTQFSTALTVYDSLGNSRKLDIYFQKTADNAWNWHLATTADQLSGQTGDTRVLIGSGQLTFTDSGALDTVTTTADSNGALAQPVQGASVTFDFAGGAQLGQTIAFDFGTPQRILDNGALVANPAAPTGFEGTTQFAGQSSTLFQSQDGYGSGVLQNFSIDEQGKVQGIFSNGQALDLKRVALAKFAGITGLKPVGRNLFTETITSGQPIVASPATSGLGSIVSGALEISNVDLSNQFVELIRAQQAFQANARIITTGDQLLTETVNLKR